MTTVDFQVAFGAVKHFGRNLYTTNPPAIAELVANGWDAYATECKIYTGTNNKALLITDNGIGMTDQEFNERYAVSGNEKNNDVRKPDNLGERPYMGRKGIGKFSVFSLGDKFIIYTKSEADQFWKKVELNYSSLMVNEPIVRIEIERVTNCEELCELFSVNLADYSSGTLIYVPEMRRQFTEGTLNSLSKLLSRRFSVNLSQKYSFKLYINENEVDLKSHFYDNSIENVYYFGVELDGMKSRFSNVEDEKDFIKIDNEYISDNNITGWIGSVAKTESLKIEDELNSSGVIVYINGKLADEDILKDNQNASIPNLYVVGEVNADYLQSAEEDPVLSSREGLNKEIQSVQLLKTELNNIRKQLTSKWNDFRASRKEKSQMYLKSIFEIPEFETEYNKLEENEKDRFRKYAQRMFDGNLNSNLALKKFYVPSLLSIVNSQTIDEISINSDDEITDILKSFVTLFDKSEINSALRLKQTHQDRINVIEELQKEIDQGAKEKVFETHLAKNPWLLNPFWDNKKDVNIIRQRKYTYLLEAGSKVNGLSDIIVEVAEKRFPIIVEIKREAGTSYSTPNYSEILAQVNKYRLGITIALKEIDPIGYNGANPKEIEAFLIIGNKATSKLRSEEIMMIESDGIKIMTYDEILNNAHNLYYASDQVLKDL